MSQLHNFLFSPMIDVRQGIIVKAEATGGFGSASHSGWFKFAAVQGSARPVVARPLLTTLPDIIRTGETIGHPADNQRIICWFWFIARQATFPKSALMTKLCQLVH
jgi:hypothetical protein